MCTFISLHRWNMLTPRMCKNIINHYDQLYHILPRISPILHFGSFQAQDIRVPARNTSVTNWDPCHGQLIFRSKSWKIRVKHKKIRWCPDITIRIRNQSKIHGHGTTICPRSNDQFYIVSYYIKLVTTSWTSVFFNIYWQDEKFEILSRQYRFFIRSKPPQASIHTRTIPCMRLTCGIVKYGADINEKVPSSSWAGAPRSRCTHKPGSLHHAGFVAITIIFVKNKWNSEYFKIINI